MASIEKGREGRGRFGSNKGQMKKDNPSSTTNVEKRKNKNFMMIAHSNKVRSLVFAWQCALNYVFSSGSWKETCIASRQAEEASCTYKQDKEQDEVDAIHCMRAFRLVLLLDASRNAFKTCLSVEKA